MQICRSGEAETKICSVVGCGAAVSDESEKDEVGSVEGVGARDPNS